MRAPRFTPWLLVVTLTAAGAAAAAGYGVTAPDRYRATAQILVSPVSAGDATFAGLDVLRDAAGKRTAAASAAVLVRSPQVADAVRAQLGIRRSSSALQDEVHAHVVGASDVVDVTAEDTSAVSAAQLANAFVDALIASRTTSFQSQLASAIRRDAQLLTGGTAGAQASELARRLAVLRSLQGQPDPTLRRASTAIAPTSASWPNVPALVAIGAGAGLAAAALVLLALALARRRGTGRAPAYDRGVTAPRTDRHAEALVDRLEQRLAGREAALAARERDLQARIDELRELESRGEPTPAQPTPPTDDGEREAALAERERQLGERVAAVTRRELEVARLAREASAAAEALDARERELAERERRPAAPAPLPTPTAAPTPAPAPAPAPAAAPADEVGGAFNLRTLERLVEERGAAHPDRVEEWDSYLFFLRDYAAPDGTLPGSFDWLIADTFRELLS